MVSNGSKGGLIRADSSAPGASGFVSGVSVDLEANPVTVHDTESRTK